jgi:hypothetical protein
MSIVVQGDDGMAFKIRNNEMMINYLKSIETSIDLSMQISHENGRTKDYLNLEGKRNIVSDIINDFKTGSVMIAK